MEASVAKESQTLDPVVAAKKKRRRKRKTNPAWLQHLGGLGVASAVRTLMGSLDCQAVLADPRVDPLHPEFAGPMIFCVWHEYFLLPLYLGKWRNFAVLASRHRDAEWVSHAAQRLGFETVRGSGRRGARAALLELLRQGKTRNLAITCDGPSGPRRRMAPGAVYLASRLKVPIVGIGVGYHSPWRASSWDRFATPRPWSRARAVFTAPYYVAENADRQELESRRVEVEALLNAATSDAEAWAASGELRAAQVIMGRKLSPVVVDPLKGDSTRIALEELRRQRNLEEDAAA